MSRFEKAWRESLDAGEQGVQLVEVNHPLEIYCGASDLGSARLMIRSDLKPQLPHLADVVVIDRQPQGEKWILSLTLQDRRFLEVFIRLAVHVVERTRSASTEESALEVMTTVFDQWRRLLTPAKVRRLGVDALRGLIGEVWFLQNRACLHRPLDAALAGWLGPLGAPQDFWYEDSEFHEIKSIGPGLSSIKISSAEQLDVTALELVVLGVPQVPEGTDGATTLLRLIQMLSNSLNEIGVSPEELELKISRVGVDLSDPYYGEMWFQVRSMSRYDVSEAFPAIRASKLPAGIGNVRYALTLASLDPFQVGHELIS